MKPRPRDEARQLLVERRRSPASSVLSAGGVAEEKCRTIQTRGPIQALLWNPDKLVSHAANPTKSTKRGMESSTSWFGYCRGLNNYQNPGPIFLV